MTKNDVDDDNCPTLSKGMAVKPRKGDAVLFFSFKKSSVILFICFQSLSLICVLWYCISAPVVPRAINERPF